MVRFWARLVELELIDRERRLVERRIKQAGFPVVKQLESFDFKAIPALNKMLVLDLARGEVHRAPRERNPARPKRRRQDPCRARPRPRRLPEGPRRALRHRLPSGHRADRGARREKAASASRAQLARVNLLIVDELGYVPLSQTGSELLFDVFSQRYENGATIVTSNLPFQEWTTVFASERLTGALLDRITHHVHILEMNGESYRLKQSRFTTPATVRITPRLTPWAHRPLPHAGRRQPRGGRIAPRAGPSHGLPGQAATEPVGHFCAAAPVHFYAAVDICDLRRRPS